MAAKSETSKKERRIGRQAAKMAQQYVLGLIRERLNTGESIHSKKIKPLLKATKVKAKMGQYRLLGLNFTSNRAGFIQHYGFSGVRAATTVMLRASRYNKTATQREASHVDLPAQDFFKEIYTKSGALDYLLQNLQETRTEAVMEKLQGLVSNLNKKEHGQ